MLLGYKKSTGSDDPYYYGKVNGVDYKFIRVVVGVALPILDRVKGCAIVLGEHYRPSAPPSWLGIDCKVGEWPAVENSLAQFRRDYKFDTVVVDREEARKIIWHMPGINYAITEIPLTSYSAPDYAKTEVGRSYSDSLGEQNRLLLGDMILREISMEPEVGHLALRGALCWMQEYKAIYLPIQKFPDQQGHILGVDGL